MGIAKRLFFGLLGKRCYFLPVSSATWEGLKRWLPCAQGEVFYNPLRVGGGRLRSADPTTRGEAIVGMVGRNAVVKDWPSFHKVCDCLRLKFEGLKFDVWALGEKECIMIGLGTRPHSSIGRWMK